MKERIRWIDNAKGICVFCVLLAHCKLHHPYIQMVYTPFFLTMFFFLSGYLYRCRTFKEDIQIDKNIDYSIFSIMFPYSFHWKR